MKGAASIAWHDTSIFRCWRVWVMTLLVHLLLSFSNTSWIQTPCLNGNATFKAALTFPITTNFSSVSTYEHKLPNLLTQPESSLMVVQKTTHLVSRLLHLLLVLILLLVIVCVARRKVIPCTLVQSSGLSVTMTWFLLWNLRGFALIIYILGIM